MYSLYQQKQLHMYSLNDICNHTLAIILTYEHQANMVQQCSQLLWFISIIIIILQQKHYENCYYKGTVQGRPDWMVALSTCHGLRYCSSSIFEYHFLHVLLIFALQNIIQCKVSPQDPWLIFVAISYLTNSTI